MLYEYYYVATPNKHRENGASEMGITQYDTQQSTQLRTMFEADFPNNMDITNKVRETRAWNELDEEIRKPPFPWCMPTLVSRRSALKDFSGVCV